MQYDISTIRVFHPGGMKMKGLLKGLRYISQIFEKEDESKGKEMQIGYPTDVKHVAHIGWDGPAVNNSPSWINDFSKGDGDAAVAAQKATTSEPESSKVAAPASSRQSRRSDSTCREGSVRRRQRSSGGPSPGESPLRDISEGSRNGRRNRGTAAAAAAAVAEQSASDPAGAAKQSHRRKAKGGSAGGGPTRSRSKAAAVSLGEPPAPTIEGGNEEEEGKRVP